MLRSRITTGPCRWPDHFALSDNGKTEWFWGGGVQVSFNRPYGKYCQIPDAPLSTGSGEFLLWEFPLAFRLKQHGYDIIYISNQDTHRDPASLLRAKGFLSVGHDEYWTLVMFCALPDHWLFKDTGMKKGDSSPGLAGWEYHGDPAPLPGLEIVATGPTQSVPGKPNGGPYTATIHASVVMGGQAGCLR